MLDGEIKREGIGSVRKREKEGVCDKGREKCCAQTEYFEVKTDKHFPILREILRKTHVVTISCGGVCLT